SISRSNHPLMILDELPMDNRPLNTGVLASDASSTTAFSNRSVDFTNRASDLNPEDIESVTVLKGPEAAALYGIDAANGAIVITTRRGQTGGGVEYSNNIQAETPRGRPEIQRVYGPTSASGDVLSRFEYFGAPYAPGTTFYDNVDGFFQTAVTTRHNLVFSGADTDNKLNYRVSASSTQQNGVVPNSRYDRVNLVGASRAQVNTWLIADLSMNYSYATNDQPLKGASGANTTQVGVGSPLLGLLLWPQTD